MATHALIRRPEATVLYRVNVNISNDHTNLGHLFLETGRLPEAVDHYEQALCIDEELFGGESEFVGDDLANVCGARAALGEAAELPGECRRAVAIVEKTAGETSPTLAKAHANLGRALAATGMLDEAAAELDAAVAVYRQCGGPDHVDTWSASVDLGVVLLRLGRTARAASLLCAELGRLDRVKNPLEKLVRRARQALDGARIECPGGPVE